MILARLFASEQIPPRVINAVKDYSGANPSAINTEQISLFYSYLNENQEFCIGKHIPFEEGKSSLSILLRDDANFVVTCKDPVDVPVVKTLRGNNVIYMLNPPNPNTANILLDHIIAEAPARAVAFMENYFRSPGANHKHLGFSFLAITEQGVAIGTRPGKNNFTLCPWFIYEPKPASECIAGENFGLLISTMLLNKETIEYQNVMTMVGTQVMYTNFKNLEWVYGKKVEVPEEY